MASFLFVSLLICLLLSTNGRAPKTFKRRPTPRHLDKDFDYFDETTTGYKIMQDVHANLKQKIAIVTGATSGLGKETVRILALAGCNVIMASRNPEKNEKVKQELIEIIDKDKARLAGKGRLKKNIRTMTLDLGDLQSIVDFVKKIYIEYPHTKIDYLINNAGL